MADALLLPPPLAGDERFQVLGQLAARISEMDLSSLLVYMVDTVNASALRALAEQFSLIGDGWELAESDEARRRLLHGAITLHRYKGTPWAIREVIRRLGFGEVELIEGLAAKTYNGESRYMGWQVFGDRTHWACYRVILNQPITRDQADQLRTMLSLFAPARCHLVGLHYAEAAHRYSGKTTFNGDYTHGVI